MFKIGWHFRLRAWWHPFQEYGKDALFDSLFPDLKQFKDVTRAHTQTHPSATLTALAIPSQYELCCLCRTTMTSKTVGGIFGSCWASCCCWSQAESAYSVYNIYIYVYVYIYICCKHWFHRHWMTCIAAFNKVSREKYTQKKRKIMTKHDKTIICMYIYIYTYIHL